MTHRTALITAGSIALVIFAAAVAVGANLGILNAADSKPVGKLSASLSVPPVPATQAKETRVSPTGSKIAGPQMYVIKKAGSVSVLASKRGLSAVNVTVKHGWRWSLSQSAARQLTVTFQSGPTTYKFLASLGPHATVMARVDEPVTKMVSSGWSGTGTAVASTAATTTPATPTPAATPVVTHSGESDDHGQGSADD